MKKIATITFHWAKNYGAVIQAFALQKYLENSGFETEIINYLPLRTMFLNFLAAMKKRDTSFFKKIKKFKKFRKNELEISKKMYFNNKSLFGCSDEYFAVICGSDQIWNKSFTSHAEGKLTLSYFLNFVGKNTKRISYATSFGSSELDEKIASAIIPELQKYCGISVRENSAQKYLSEIGINSKTVVDPTLLLEEQDYLSLIENREYSGDEEVLTYIIHHNQVLSHNINHYVVDKYNGSNFVIKDCDIYEWLYRIKNSKIVVTNSFHGTVFSLIFHKPFITAAIPGSGMNDRLITLLEAVGLSDRFMQEFEASQIDSVLNSSINWDEVDEKLNDLRKESKTFLSEALG